MPSAGDGGLGDLLQPERPVMTPHSPTGAVGGDLLLAAVLVTGVRALRTSKSTKVGVRAYHTLTGVIRQRSDQK